MIQNMNKFMVLIDDMDQILKSNKDYLVGVWIENAKQWGDHKEER